MQIEWMSLETLKIKKNGNLYLKMVFILERWQKEDFNGRYIYFSCIIMIINSIYNKGLRFDMNGTHEQVELIICGWCKVE